MLSISPNPRIGAGSRRLSSWSAMIILKCDFISYKRKNETYDSDSIFSIFIIAKVGFVFSASENTTTSQTGPLWYPRAQ